MTALTERIAIYGGKIPRTPNSFLPAIYVARLPAPVAAAAPACV